MSQRERYMPGPASRTQVRKDGDKWTFVLVRELRHPPEKVWQALTDPAHVREWAPFDVDGSLAEPGTVNVTWVGNDRPTAARVIAAEPPRRLEFNDTKWELERIATGTRLTLWASIDRRYIAMGAAGWHISLDVLEHALNGTPIGRIAGPEAMQFDGWKQLTAQYALQFGKES